jgi:hypothetical protein
VAPVITTSDSTGAAARQRVHVLANQQEEPVAAVEVAAVEAGVWLELVRGDRIHQAALSN